MTTLVTGGTGLLGRALIAQLLERGEAVRSFDRVPFPDRDVQTVIGDVRNYEDVLQAVTGMDTVHHTVSAIDQTPGKPQFIYDINVTGTANVIRACKEAGVRKLIYTSSIDAVFDGTPIRGGDESLPYPQRHLNYYSETKAEAEQMVLAASDDDLLTCALRSAGIFGPHDRHRFPAVLGSVRESGNFTRIGDGSAKFNHVYVDNLAHAHLLAAARLMPASPVVGSVYFIVDAPPTNFFDFFLPYLRALDLPTSGSTIPRWVASIIAAGVELGARLNPRNKNDSTALTRYVVNSVATDFWFNGGKAQRELDYQPIIDREEAQRRTIEWLKSEQT
jgi:nucleoside-diphosphate-sugar epimerase